MNLTKFSRAIETRYIAPTNTKGARVRAVDGNRSIIISYDKAINQTSGRDAYAQHVIHFQAVKAFIEKYGLDWGDNWGCASTENGRGYYFFTTTSYNNRPYETLEV